MSKLVKRDADDNGITWDYEDGNYLRLVYSWIDWQGHYNDGYIEFTIISSRNLFNLILKYLNKLNNVLYAEKLLSERDRPLKLCIEKFRFKDKFRTGKTTTWTNTYNNKELIICTWEWNHIGEIHFTVYNKNVYDKLLQFVIKFEPPSIVKF